jgi:glycosyltransferase involved in cell wall biosynthesis
VVPQVVKKSKRIITVSLFEQKRIVDFFGFKDDKKLIAVYNGVGSHFKRVENPEILSAIKIKYQLPDQFFFHLGNTDPKKNTKGVLKAYSDFLKITGAKISLVMLDFDTAELQKILKEIRNETLIESIHLTGYVVNTDLPTIYSLCSLFLYPSLRESFGIPILEAMACGTPVITSNTSSMPEIAGNAALLVNPFDTEEIVQAMLSIYQNPSLQLDLTTKGYLQASLFSWKAMAEHVLQIYEDLSHSI